MSNFKKEVVKMGAFPNLTSGMSAMMKQTPKIDTEEHEPQSKSKVVKLRFTNRQYEAFREACSAFEVMANDPNFSEFVKKVFGDIKMSTVPSQLVNPIVEAPTRIPIKVRSTRPAGQPAKESYFTQPTPATDSAKQLFSKAAKYVDKEALRQDIPKGTTCITDIRILMSAYINENNLRVDDGVILDNFIFKLAPKVVQEYKSELLRVENKYAIPKGNRKIMTAIINEITFGK